MFNKSDKHTQQGRIMNRKAKSYEIKIYLGLEDLKQNRDIVKEYRKFEKKYFNEPVEFCLNCDLGRFGIEEDIIEKGQYIIVFNN